MSYSGKFLSIILAAVFIFSPTVFLHSDTVAKADGEKVWHCQSGYVIIEAEDMTYDSSSCAVYSDSDASGSKGLATTAAFQSDVSLVGKVTFGADVRVSDFGVYNIWARVKTTDSGRDSVFMSINGLDYKLVSFVPTPDYYWFRLGSVLVEEADLKLEFKYREKNFKIDKLVITNDTSFAPVQKDDTPKPDGSGNLWAEPAVKPIAGHPRLYLTPDYIPILKENVKSAELEKPWTKVKAWSGENLTVSLKDTENNHSSALENKIMARALCYVMGETGKTHAEVTISLARDYLSQVKYNLSTNDITRAIGRAMVMGAVVYDWCYDALTDEDMEFFVAKFREFALQKEIGYPPVNLSSVNSHGGEAELMRDLLSVSVAIYDEYPTMYNLAAGRFFEEFIDSRALFNASGIHPGGGTYGQYRYQWELFAEEIFGRMGYENVFGNSSEKLAMQWIYKRRPDGLFLKDGDEPAYSRNSYFKYSAESPLSFALSAHLHNNPYIKSEWLKQHSLADYSGNEIWAVLFAEPSVEAKLPDDLPLAISSDYPLSSVTMRTSWQEGIDSPAALINMKAYETAMFDHMHSDAGSFQVYYKGYLAADGGNYHGKNGNWGSEHFYNYAIRSAAHNVMTVYDPDEKFIIGTKEYANDGGQLVALNVNTYGELLEKGLGRAECNGIYIGPNSITPEFSYIQSDLTGSYSDKVSSYKRSMVAIDLFDDDCPAAFIVFDKIASSDASFKKTWNLQSIEEPQISGNVTTIARTQNGYDGKLVNRTLLPGADNLLIEKVGGFEADSMVDGVNYPNPDNDGCFSEQGSWRTEISPLNPSKNDLFLNVMYVTDNSKNLPILSVSRLDFEKLTGAVIKDRAVLFSKSGEDIESRFEITIPVCGYDTVGIFVADVKDGMWNIKGNGTDVNIRVSSKENALYFRAGSGSYTITPVSDSVTAYEIRTETVKKSQTGDFRIYNNGIFRYNKNATKLVNGTPCVPLDFFEWLGADVTDDSYKTTISFVDTKGEFTRKSERWLLNGEVRFMREAVAENGGTVYIPVEDVEELCGQYFRYDKAAKILFVEGASSQAQRPAVEAVFFAEAESEQMRYLTEFKLRFGCRASNTTGNETAFYVLNGQAHEFSGSFEIYPEEGRNELYIKLIDSAGRTVAVSSPVIFTGESLMTEKLLTDDDFYSADRLAVKGQGRARNENQINHTVAGIYGSGADKYVKLTSYRDSGGSTGDALSYMQTCDAKLETTASHGDYDKLVSYEADYWFDDMNAERELMRVKIYKDSSYQSYVYTYALKLGTDGKLSLNTYSGNTQVLIPLDIEPLTTGEWYRFRVDYNLRNRTADVYVGELCVAKDVRILKNSVTNNYVGYLNLNTGTPISDSTYSTIRLDNIKERYLVRSKLKTVSEEFSTDGIPVGSEGKISGGILTSDVTLISDGEEKEIRFFTAVYDGNQLKAIGFTDWSFGTESIFDITNEVDIQNADNSKIYTIKNFFWNGGTLMPYEG